MALVTYNNGDPITRATVNNIKDLLTGAMLDQLTQMGSLHVWKAKGAAPGAPTLAIAAGGGVDTGAHTYAITFVGQTGEETVAGTTAAISTTGGNNTVNLTAIPTGPSGTVSRKVYRSKVGTTSPLFLVTTIANNSATTYSDTATDASLPGTNPPTHSTFGGTTQWQNSAGTVKAQIFGTDGAFSFDGGNIVSDGAGALTLNGALSVGGNLLSTGTGSLAFTGAGRTDPANDTTYRIVKSATNSSLDFVGGSGGFRFIKNDGASFTSLFAVDNSGNATLAAILSIVGALKHTTSPTTLNGTTAGNVKWYMPFQGAGLKVFVAWAAGYQNSTVTAQNIVLPTDFVTGAVAINIGAGSSWTPKDSGGTGINFSETTLGTGTGAGSQSNRTGIGFSTMGHVNGAIHSIDLPVSMGSAVTGPVILIGF
jgi:fibronectin-binding autotransporter adhesin